MRFARFLTGILFALLFVSSSLFASVGNIQGRVLRDGNPVKGVSVVVEGPGINTVTDSHGAFFIGGIPAGEYNIIFTPKRQFGDQDRRKDWRK